MGTPQRITVYPKENMDLSEIQKMINDYINKEDEKKEDEKVKERGVDEKGSHLRKILFRRSD